MIIQTLGTQDHPAILFFHAMGVTGDSSLPTAEYLKENYFCIMPTSTVYCKGQTYRGKADEVRQIVSFLQAHGVRELALVAASSIGADLAMEFLSQSPIRPDHVFFDGGQFAQISGFLRRVMTPFLYAAIKSLYRSNGKTLKHILWCDDEAIRPYFIEAGRNLTWGNLRRQLADSLEDKPFPALSPRMQQRTFWEFGSLEDHFKYRAAVMEAYPQGRFPVFEGYNHMQYQIRDPRGFAQMLKAVIAEDRLPPLPFLR